MSELGSFLLVTGSAILLLLFAGGRPSSYYVLGLLYLLPSYWAAVVAHELGHIIAAKAAGISPTTLAFGNVWLRFVGPPPRVGLLPVFFAGGMVTLRPNLGATRVALAISLFGGAAANLLLLFLGLGLYLVAPTTSYWQQAMGSVIALTNLLLVSVSLYPGTIKGMRTDANLARLCWIKQASTEAMVRLLALQSEQYEGIRPRDWNRDHAGWLLANKHVYEEPVGIDLLAYYMAIDEDKVDTAESLLKSALVGIDLSTFLVGDSLLIEAAFFYGWHKPDLALCGEYLSLVPALTFSQDSRLRAEAAHAFVLGDLGKAKFLAEQSLHLGSRAIAPGLALYEREQLSELIRSCGERLTETDRQMAT